MALFDSIAEAQKQEILQATRVGLVRELYSLLVLFGVDPETYVLGSWEPRENPMVDPGQVRLMDVDAAIRKIDEKLAG